MASLNVNIGALTGSKSANNTKAQQVADDFCLAVGITGTNQQKLDGIAAHLTNYMVERAHIYRRNLRLSEANATTDTEVSAIDWT